MSNLEKLIDTLDVEYYENMSELEKKELTDYLYVSNNKPLQTIINNFEHRKENKLDIDYIYGPTYFQIYKKDDKQIILIGERHDSHIETQEIKYSENKKIMDIYEYLLYLFKYSYIPIDFFLESMPTMITDNLVRLGKLRYILKPCLSKKFDCPYYTTRFHNVDIRHINDKHSLFGSWYKFDDLLRLENVKQHSKAYYMLMKQIDKCENEIIKNKALNFINDDYNALFTKSFGDYDPFISLLFKKLENMVAINGYCVLINLMKKHNLMDSSNGEILTNHMIFKFHQLSLYAMDYYTICRFFRKFKKDVKHIFIEPRNIILYSGSSHADHIGSLLKKAKFKKHDLQPFRINMEKTSYMTQVNNVNLFNLNNFSEINMITSIEKQKPLSYLREPHFKKKTYDRIKLVYNEIYDTYNISYDEFIDLYYDSFDDEDQEKHNDMSDKELLSVLKDFLDEIKNTDNIFKNDGEDLLFDERKKEQKKTLHSEKTQYDRIKSLYNEIEDTYDISYDEFIDAYHDSFDEEEQEKHNDMTDNELLSILKDFLDEIKNTE